MYLICQNFYGLRSIIINFIIKLLEFQLVLKIFTDIYLMYKKKNINLKLLFLFESDLKNY
jgi:hypothetical protein